MAVSYVVNKTGTTFAVRYRAEGPGVFPELYRYTEQWAFMPFDLPTAGISAGMVASAQLILRCTATVGGGCHVHLYTAVDPNGFGATLDATHDDWASTETNSESVTFVNATGVFTWDLDPEHLSYTGISYLKLKNDDGEGAPYQTAALFNSQNAGTPSNRPILRLTLRTGQVIFLQEA